MAPGKCTPPLLAATTPCFLNGTMTSMQGRRITLTTSLWEATSGYGGQVKHCPKGKRHSWSATAYSRTRTHASGCPFCAHKQPCDCNSLQNLDPKLAADFDSKANGVTPDEVTASTSVKYWWLSDTPAAPLRSVNQRTKYNHRKLRRRAGGAVEGLYSSTGKVGTSHYMPC